MGMFKWLSGLFGNENEVETPANIIREPISSLRIVQVKPAESYSEPLINPATGQPMVGGATGLDILGNPYGVDTDDNDIIGSGLGPHHDLFDNSSICEADSFDSFNHCGINDSFSSSDDW